MKKFASFLIVLIVAALFASPVMAAGNDRQIFSDGSSSAVPIVQLKKGDIIVIQDYLVPRYCDYDRNIVTIRDGMSNALKVTCSYIGYERSRKR